MIALQYLVQQAIGEKVGNLLHNVGTFVAGMAVAFSRGWSMTLVLLAVVPIMAVLGLLFATVSLIHCALALRAADTT